MTYHFVNPGQRPPRDPYIQPQWWKQEDRCHFSHVTWRELVDCRLSGHRGESHVGYGRIIAVNGISQVRLICEFCGDKLSERIYAHDGLDIESISIIGDRRTGTPCARCGGTSGVEYHHWAPSHLFDDSDDWPGSSLCPECHRRWHKVTRTGAFYRMGEVA